MPGPGMTWRRWCVTRSADWHEPWRAAVSNHGQITRHFVGPDEYEAFQRCKQSRRSFATADLPEGKVMAIGASRMDAWQTHLEALLDQT